MHKHERINCLYNRLVQVSVPKCMLEMVCTTNFPLPHALLLATKEGKMLIEDHDIVSK